MSVRRMALVVCCIVPFLLVGNLHAEDGWKLPNLNPFKKGTTTSKSSSALELPKLGLPMVKPKSSNKPSGLSKVAKGTKDFFAKSYDVLTPWDTEAEKAQDRRENSPMLFSNTGTSQKKEEKSMFASWFVQEEEPAKPRTVSEWLAQPRP